MESAWFCVVLHRNLCSQGIKAARDAMWSLAGEAFLDFRLVDDGFDSDAYAFVKCRPDLLNMDGFRTSSRVLSVLDSYGKPTFLNDDEVYGFVVEEAVETQCLNYGDTVLSLEGPYSGLHGVVSLPGCVTCLVLFRFHTVSKREWMGNETVVRTGNVFSRLKVPVLSDSLFGKDKKYPILESDLVCSGQSDRKSNRAD